MQQRLKVSPTKSVLIHLKKQVTFLEQGHDLLERKKELLTRLVYERLKTYRELRGQAHQSLQAAYRSLGVTHVRMGEHALHTMAVGMKPAVDVNILPRSSIGVQYPSVKVERLKLSPVGLLGTDASFDATRERFADMVSVLAELGEAETALWRLLEEQRKTQKRVNALKYNVIPKYRATIRFIESNLEEEERNTLFQIKVLREKSAM